jgi:alpha-beta hydrolase superfamily lysophospholipase
MKTKAKLGIISLLAVLSLSALAGCDGDPQPASKKSYVLVHGAWMGAWCWDDVARGLRAQGATVTTVELPAHGSDQTPLPEASLDGYVTKVRAAVAAAPAPVILVGHSMGGMVVTGVAEADGASLAKVVYLGAYLPKDGQSLYDLASTDAASHLGPALVVDPQEGLAKLPGDMLEDIFNADGTPDPIARVISNYRDEPLAPFVTPIHTTTAGWGAVSKAYIYTKDDHAISFDLQQAMTTGVTMTDTITIETSHAPFLSRPELLVSALASM